MYHLYSFSHNMKRTCEFLNPSFLQPIDMPREYFMMNIRVVMSYNEFLYG